MKKNIVIGIVVALLILGVVVFAGMNNPQMSKEMGLDMSRNSMGGGKCSCTGNPGCSVECPMGKRAKCHNCATSPACECV